MKASDLFIKAMENEGVEYIFGIPGEENLDFLDSLRDSSIKLVLTRHEQAAAFMAATYGRLTGRPGVCLSTLGPGATNLVTGAAYAQLGAMPLVMITGQKPIRSSKQGRFQIIDTVEMMRPLTKYSRQIVDARNIPSVTREAFRLAMEERPGAVHLELPEDIAAEEIESEVLFEVPTVRRPYPDPEAIRTAVEMIQSAKSPLLLIGAGGNRNRISEALEEFVTRFKIPFFNTQMGTGVLDEQNELFLGTAALSAHDYLHCAIDRADLIINVGHDVIEKPPFFMENGGTKVIHVNYFSAQVDDVYFPQHEVVGDIANSVIELTEQMTPQKTWDFDYFMRVKGEVETFISDRADSESFPLFPQRIVADVRKALPSDGILTLDNGMYKIWFARNYKAHVPNTLLLDNALATMGAGLPSAIGAKIVSPDRQVMTVCGDGGFMMNSQELETAVRLGLDLVVVILNDSSYGMIKWKQSGMGMDNFGLDFKNPDFVAYAESYGVKGHRIESTDAFYDVLHSCLNTSGVHLIDVPIDYSENERVLIEELKGKTCLL